MSLILARFLCGLGFHCPMPGVDPQMSIRWVCCHCHGVQPGRLAVRK